MIHQQFKATRRLRQMFQLSLNLLRIITIIKPAAGLLANPRPAGTIIEQLVEEVHAMESCASCV